MRDPAAIPTALVLAGSRGGVDDPLGAYAGVTDKALIVIDGLTMLARVVAALRAAGVERIVVSASTRAVTDHARALGVEVLAAAPGPSRSVGSALATLGAPLLVTTADHALLRPEWITRFLADLPANADVGALLARRDVVERAVGEHAVSGTRRTWLRFADGAWSGCNLFHLATPRAAAAIDLWQGIERDRKRPWRIVRRLGPGMLARYVLGRLTLVDAVAALGARVGIACAAVACPWGLAAVDVDKPADLDLVRTIVTTQ